MFTNPKNFATTRPEKVERRHDVKGCAGIQDKWAEGLG